MRLLFENIAEEVVEALLSGQVPWQRLYGAHRHVVTERSYHGVNSLLLQINAKKNQFQSPFWAPRHTWHYLGCKLKPDAVGTRILFYNYNKSGTIRTDSQHVFNLEQVVEARHRPVGTTADYESALLLVNKSGADIRPSKLSVYHYDEDYILLPEQQWLDKGRAGRSGYFYGAFHELAHWTEKRVGWAERGLLAELRAEMVAGFLATEFNLPLVPVELILNHGQHLQQWVQAIRADPEMLLRVSSAATAATDYLLNFIRNVQERENLLCERGPLP